MTYGTPWVVISSLDYVYLDPNFGDKRMNHFIKPVAFALFAITSAGIVLPNMASAKDISKINGVIQTEANQTYDNLDTVNGSITLNANSSADSADTVNGSITVKANARLGSADAVNGDITVEEGGLIEESVDLVNGDIEVARNGTVGSIDSVNGDMNFDQGVRVGKIDTVNGDIIMDSAEISGGVITVNSDITMNGASRIIGDVRYKRKQSNGWFFGLFKSKQKPVHIKISAQSEVSGDLIFEGFEEGMVKLDIAPGAKVGNIVGVK